MCAVAKSFQRCDIMGEPFVKNGRKYVTIETPFGGMRNVRWYTDAEYAKMYPGEVTKTPVAYRDILGFGDAGYITIYYGDTYKNLEWFKESPVCRYHKIWGWYTPSNMEIPNDIPKDVTIAQLKWSDVCDEAGMINETKTAAIVESIRYSQVNSGEYVGEIGDRDVFELKIEKVIGLDGYYGHSSMHIMTDANGNTFVWNTATKTLEVGTTYNLKGTIKDHKEYKGVKQTILTRCTIMKNK